jgi:hypothetical protein
MDLHSKQLRRNDRIDSDEFLVSGNCENIVPETVAIDRVKHPVAVGPVCAELFVCSCEFLPVVPLADVSSGQGRREPYKDRKHLQQIESFVSRQGADICASMWGKGNDAFRHQPFKRLADGTATDLKVVREVCFDELLAGDEPANDDAVGNRFRYSVG